MELNHYGITVNSEKPVTGVVTNHEPEFLLEDARDGIDLSYEEYVADCESHGIEPEDGEFGQGPLLVGWIESPLGADIVSRSNQPHFVVGAQPFSGPTGHKAFVPDPDAEYQAIVGDVYTQVIWSRFVQRSPLCSPCYPGQGDLDTPVPQTYHHTGFLTYTLPPDVWGERKDWRMISQYCETRGEVCYA